MRRAVPFVVAGLSLSACDLADLDPPPAEISVTRSYAFSGSVAARAGLDPVWWTALGDPALDELIRRGDESNLDIAAALERIREAEARLGAVSFGRASGTLQASGTRTWQSGGSLDVTTAVTDAAYLIDLFGAQRRRIEAAEATLEAEHFSAEVARIAFQSAVVASYLDARYFQNTHRIQSQAVARTRQVEDATRSRLDRGEGTQLDLRRAEADRAQAEARLAELRTGLRVRAFTLATLIGAPGEDVLDHLVQSFSGIPRPPVQFDPGIPAELLRNRPDIRAAEARLAAAYADLGVAEAELYPSLSLTGSVTIGEVGEVSVGPRLSLPLFDRPARMGNRDAAESRARQAAITWQATVAAAVEEVQRALAETRGAANRVAGLARAEAATGEIAQLSREIFATGQLTTLALLDAEGDLADVQLQLAEARRSHAAAWARLNAALGAGWKPPPRQAL